MVPFINSEIYLDRNVLSRIEHGTFAALPELRLLGLSHNRLAPSPGSMMFANLRSLVQLDLVHNRITRWVVGGGWWVAWWAVGGRVGGRVGGGWVRSTWSAAGLPG